MPTVLTVSLTLAVSVDGTEVPIAPHLRTWLGGALKEVISDPGKLPFVPEVAAQAADSAPAAPIEQAGA